MKIALSEQPIHHTVMAKPSLRQLTYPTCPEFMTAIKIPKYIMITDKMAGRALPSISTRPGIDAKAKTVIIDIMMIIHLTGS